MLKIFTSLIVFFYIYSVQANNFENIRLETKRGELIEAVFHYPKIGHKVPAVVIGPGRGYQMEFTLIKGLAEKIVEKGYAVIRFNWHFYSEQTQPSKGLINELEDYSAAVDFLKGNDKVDGTQIIAVGKSLGSVVSHNYFEKDLSIKSLILMTPICSSQWDDKGNELPEAVPVGDKYYPKLKTDKRKTVVVLGDRDPNCSLPMLYDFLKSSKGNISVVTVEGDHSLNIGKWDDPKYKTRNLQNNNAAIDMMAHWVDLIFKSGK